MIWNTLILVVPLRWHLIGRFVLACLLPSLLVSLLPCLLALWFSWSKTIADGALAVKVNLFVKLATLSSFLPSCLASFLAWRSSPIRGDVSPWCVTELISYREWNELQTPINLGEQWIREQ